MPRVSIGLPVYNGANYLAGSIDSIRNQTFTDFELIISDNASTDDTEALCRAYVHLDPRIRYFRQERNLGCALNSNFVFHQSTGEYFKWISHDDLHAPRFVEACVDVLDRQPDVVICCPKGILIDEFGSEIKMQQRGGRNFYIASSGRELTIRPYDRGKRLDSRNPVTRFRDLILYTNWCLEIYGLVRREALARTSLHGTYHGTDKRVLAELSLLGRFALLDEVMLYYRQHPVQAQRYQGSAVARDLYLSGDVARQWSKLPRWKNLNGYCQAVQNADLDIGSRLACYTAIGRWFLQPAKWAPILREGAQICAALADGPVRATEASR
jgi:glycosyltransferase involved in cell wall biosynthesis